MSSGTTDIIYEYMNGALSKVKTYAENDSGTAYEEYNHTYDVFGNQLSVSVGNMALSTNTYAPNNGKLTSSTYGNGVTVNYFYDHLDRVVKKCYNGNEDTAFLYLYNGLGALSSVTDTATQEKISYVYDTVGRPSETRTEDGDNIFRVLYGYDEISRPNTLTYKYNNAYTQKYSTSYIADNRITLFKLNNGQSDVFSIVPTFDTLGRQTSRTLKNGSGAQVDKEVYSFLAGAGGNNASTSVISSVGYYGADSTVDETYTYTYDDIGNIKTVSKNGVQIAAYTYNSLNILTGYTDAGNIYHSYGYTPGHNLQEIDNYGILYQDDVWLDRATKIFNFLSMREYAVTYDEIGNTLSYRDGMSFTWKNGRQLATFTQGQTSASYDYNESGIRNKKTVNGVTTTFQLAGSMIVSENRNGNTIQYYYNEAGSVIGLRYNGNDYFFRRNLQGDIISILNTAGQTVVSYEYDPWGNILAVTGSLASTLGADNPFRYRGYYYDTESCFYYLNSRYYDAKVCRFVNADCIISPGLTGTNLFAYCGNNPITGYDPTGNFDFNKLIGGICLVLVGVAAVAAVAVSVASCGAAAAPASMALIEAATAVAGYVTAVNGVSEIVESATGENPVRTIIFRGNREAYEDVTQIMAWIASAGTGAIIEFENVTGGQACFVSGTMVATSTGNIPIESIKPGDMVWATNPDSGETELKQVVRTFVRESDELVHVFVKGDEIVCTNEHPFYSPVKGWTAACDLRAGDVLVTVNGEYVVVEFIQHELLESPVLVYNFEVEDFHTYYVGTSVVLVHNSCNHGSSWRKERERYWKETGKSAIEGNDYGAYVADQDNIDKMLNGRAPIGKDYYSVQLHHWEGIAKNFYNYSPVTRTEHIWIHKLIRELN